MILPRAAFAWGPSPGLAPAPRPRGSPADLAAGGRLVGGERLHVGVQRDEVDPLEAGRDHGVHRVVPAPPTPTTRILLPRLLCSNWSIWFPSLKG